MPKKVTLTSPETTATVTSHQISRVEVDALSGKCECIVIKKDDSGNQIGAYRVELTLGATPLNTFLSDVLSQAQTDGTVPAGSVVDI